MTDRTIFNRRYSSFTPGSSEVWLVNGAGVTTSASKTSSFTAGESLTQGTPVYVSGVYVLAASAASGIDPSNYNVVGFTAEAASTSASVDVVLDDTAIISSGNLVHEVSLTPGIYYYVSNIVGKITNNLAPSGITTSGGYAALAPVGLALSSSELSVEISSPVILS